MDIPVEHVARVAQALYEHNTKHEFGDARVDMEWLQHEATRDHWYAQARVAIIAFLAGGQQHGIR